jgi:hypothetical protein
VKGRTLDPAHNTSNQPVTVPEKGKYKLRKVKVQVNDCHSFSCLELPKRSPNYSDQSLCFQNYRKGNGATIRNEQSEKNKCLQETFRYDNTLNIKH